MPTIGVQITAEGPVNPSYEDILQQFKIRYWSIFGSDAALDFDTQDGQWLGVLAENTHDLGQAVVAAYNAFSPTTAQGAGLSSVVKINGIRRLSASASSVVITVGGVVGTIINGGIVGDGLGLRTQWELPAVVTIPDAGQIDVVAFCTEIGATAAAIGSLTTIITPTRGWQTATNAAPATLGNPVESDATLRRRQAASTSNPAETPLGAIIGAVANVAGVGRSRVYENDSDATDGDGIPSHSISAVVSGGVPEDIAASIADKKAPGTGTFGTTSVVVIDPKGVPNTINYFILAGVTVEVQITIVQLDGYVGTTGALIKAAVAEFISSLDIGETDYLNRLFAPANLTGDAAVRATGLTQAQLNILSETYTVALGGILQSRAGPLLAQDVVIAFNEAASCNADDDVALVVT